MKQNMLVDIMVDVSSNPIDESEFRNKLAKWITDNRWSLNGFIGEYIEEGEDLHEIRRTN